MNNQQKRSMLNRFEKVAAVAFFEQLRVEYDAAERGPGLDEGWAKEITLSIPEIVCQELGRCRQAGLTNDDLRPALEAVKQRAICDFRYFLQTARDGKGQLPL